MKYDLTKPCDNCPFTKDKNFFFRKKRADEIINANSFSCHKTTTSKGKKDNDKNAQACAGRMILLEREGKPDQMMRIAHRLGLYNPKKLDIDDKDVYSNLSDFYKQCVD